MAVDNNGVINITPDYYISVDEMSYTLKKWINGKSTRYPKVLGYYSTLRGALNALIDINVRSCLSVGERDLYSAIDDIKTINKEMAELIRAAVPEMEVR